MRIRWRPPMLIVLGALSLGLAYLLRQGAHDLVIVPLAYVWWLGRLIYLTIPQFVRWTLLVFMLALALLWQMLPEPRPASRIVVPSRRKSGPVALLAVWILKARRSNYYKWQLAHRLGRTARALSSLWGVHAPARSPSDDVRGYLDAGTDHSFVEYAGPRSRFRRRKPTPLDLDPSAAVEYLESQMEMSSGAHVESI